ncbi:HTH_Tnp_Tc3_2 domain-containing protein [Trichonephila clavipes]|nr:HTH_Tnp_Tc3_2 domain-containing protein [Trichonephila clavipes]
MSFTRRPVSGSPRQTSRQEDHHITRKAHVQPTASLAAIQAQVTPSLGAPASSRTIRRRLAEGRVLPFKPTHRHLRLEWSRARGNWTAAEWIHVVFSDENPDSISAVMTIAFVIGDRVANASILPLLYSDTPLPHKV